MKSQDDKVKRPTSCLNLFYKYRTLLVSFLKLVLWVGVLVVFF